MPRNTKIFLFSMVVFLLSFLPALAGQSDFGFDVKRFEILDGIVKDDFPVNNDFTDSVEYSPAVARDDSGNFIITWVDKRTGNYEIYAQRFTSSGTLLGTNFWVNDDAVSANHSSPAIAMDGSGNFVITWQDERNGNSDIYAQRYNASGVPLDSNFKVNDDVGTSSQDDPAITMDDSGNFIITWTDGRNAAQDIYAQRYNSSGVPLNSNFKVDDDTGIGSKGYPDIASDGSGNFVIVWEDYRTGGLALSDIFAQRYNCYGTPLGPNFTVNDVTTSFQLTPAIAIDSSGSFVVTWADHRNGQYNCDIYARRFDPLSNPLGSSFKVNADAGIVHQYCPVIAMDTPGNFVITWEDQRNGYDSDIYAQRYNFSGALSGSNFRVNDDAGTAYQGSPAISSDNSGNFVITWGDYRNGKCNTFGQRYNSSGDVLGSNFLVKDEGTAFHVEPTIAINKFSKFIIAWTDYRNGNFDIYAQRYNSSDAPSGSNFKVNHDTGAVYQDHPSVAMDDSDNFVITWADERNGDRDIYAQRYRSSGTRLGSNFKVNDDVGTSYQYYPDIAMDNVGNFVITWQDYRNGNSNIYAQRYNFSGALSGSNFRVTDDVGTAWGGSPAISSDNSGNFIITWEDGRNVYLDIYAQRYDSLRTPIGGNFKVNNQSGYFSQESPDIAMDDSDNFIIIWQDYRNGGYPNNPDVYAQRYSSSGTPLGSNFKVNDDFGTPSRGIPAIAMDGSGNFVITWRDERNGNRDIYAQRYNSSGNPDSNNYLIPNPLYASFDQLYPAVASVGSKTYFTWTDTRKGWDIYAKVVDWSWTDVKDEQKVGLPKSFELSQNYPNPFNQSTKIEFTLAHSGFATLNIYDILGRKIRTLVSENLSPGYKSVFWDGKSDSGKEVASGIFFYKLRVGNFSETKKLVLLK